MLLPLILLLLHTARAAAPDALPTPDDRAEELTEDRQPVRVEVPSEAPGPVRRPFPDVLEQAKQSYFRGGHGEALALLLELGDRVRGGEDVARADAVEALTYLGEVLMNNGRGEEGQAAFELLLRRWPDQPINVYAHPREVVMVYQSLQRDVRRELHAASLRPTPQLPPPPLPPWGYLPLGAPQLGQGQPARGVVYAGLQLGLQAGAYGAYRWCRTNAKEIPDTDVDAFRRFQTVRIAGWGMQTAAIGVWAASYVDAHHRWRRRPREATALTIVPTEAGGGAALVTGRF